MSTSGGALRGLRPVIIWLIALAGVVTLVGLFSMSWAYLHPLRPHWVPPGEAVDVACRAATKILDGVPAKEESASRMRLKAAAAEAAAIQAKEDAKRRRAKYNKSKADRDNRAAVAAAKDAKKKRDVADAMTKQVEKEQTALKKLGSDARLMLEAVGVADHNYGSLPVECGTGWKQSRMIASGISVSAATSACGVARDNLKKGDFSTSRSALVNAGVTNENAALLDDECDVWWKLAGAPTQDQKGVAKPSASGSSQSKKAATALEKLACGLATSQLNNGKPADAYQTLKAAGVTTKSSPACAAALTLSTSLKPEPPASPESNAIQERADGWGKFLTSYVVPLKNLGAFALAGWLALFVLARLLVETPWLRHRASTRGERRLIGWIGWSLLILTPILLGAAGVGIGMGLLSGAAPALLVTMFIALGALGLIASFGVAAWLSTLLKITISAKSNKDATMDPAPILARLRELASGSNNNIEVPSAQTIADVNSTLTELSKAEWIAAIQKVLMFLVGISPWVAAVEVRGDREANVTLGRNGRVVLAKNVRTDGPGLEVLGSPPPPADANAVLMVFLAAEILLGMRPAYVEDFAPGLNGATSAKSVALQHVAQRWYMNEVGSPEAEILLGVAVAADPENQLAMVTLEYARWRQSTDVDDLSRYGSWINGLTGLGGPQ